MFAAAYGLPSAAATRERLEKIVQAAEPAARAQYVLTDGAGLVACTTPTARLTVDAERRSACLSDLPDAWDPAIPWERARGSFCAVELQADGLVLARGRFGGRSLFYAREAGGTVIIACSRLEPIVRTLVPAPAFDEDVITELLAGLAEHGGRTVYRQIRRVPSACIVRLSRAGETSHELEPLRIRPPGRGEDARETGRELRRSVERAIERALLGTTRVAVAAGGGLDSSTLLASVIASARGANAREVRAIALDFGGPGSDRPYLRELADNLGIVPARVTPAQCARHLPSSLVIDGAPVNSPAMAWGIELARTARQLGAEILLVGGGGDDLFDGDLGTFAEDARQGHLARALISTARLRGLYWLPSARARMEHLVVRPLVRRAMPRTIVRAVRAARRFPRRHGQPWAGPRLRRFVAARGTHADDATPVPWARRIAGLATAGYLLDIRDARCQVELRSGCAHTEPYLREEIVEFVAGIPAPDLFYGRWRRGLFREAIRGLVPEPIRLREDKASGGAAIAEMFGAGEALRAFRPLLSMQALGDRGLVDPDRFRDAIEAAAQRPGDGLAWSRLWPALTLEALLRDEPSMRGAAAS